MMKNNLLFISLICILICRASGQHQGIGVEDFTNPTESPNGYWRLSGTDTEFSGVQSGGMWDGNPGDISISLKWKDRLQIVHTVNCRYQWETPPVEIKPGENIRMAGTYINNEYSTTSKLGMGLSIGLHKVNVNDTKISNQPNEFVRIVRDSKNYENETKVGLVQAPRTGNKNTELQLTVQCYAGGTKYTTTYTYEWIGNGN